MNPLLEDKRKRMKISEKTCENCRLFYRKPNNIIGECNSSANRYECGQKKRFFPDDSACKYYYPTRKTLDNPPSQPI